MERVWPRAVVRIVTLGCAKNEVDSDKMRAALASAGFRMSDSDAGDADAVIVNTCSFIEEATRESIDAILGVVEPGPRRAKVIVAGCMPSRYADDLAAEFPEVAAFVPVEREGGIVRVVEEVLGLGDGDLDGSPFASIDSLPGRTLQAPYAYVKISDGCDRFCSFCTIPFIRGRYASRTAAEITAEVDALAEMGVREVILIGQDTGIWGDDLDDGCREGLLRENSLACLMAYLAERHPDVWFRVMYLQPRRTDDELLGVMASHGNICNYLDIPLQHCSARVLSEMNREGSREEFEALLAHVRELVPGVTLRTTMIAGFPGETEEEADDLVEFVEQAGFDFAGVFEYSQEDGTAAAEMPGQIDQEVKVARAQAVRDAAEATGAFRARSHIGSVERVLVCGVDDEAEEDSGSGTRLLWGRTMFQAPDVDGTVGFEGSDSLVGSIVSVRITDSAGFDLEGELLP